MFTEKIERLFQNIDLARKAYNQSFRRGGGFDGPSLHYHETALAAASESREAFAREAYAMLVSWGMHRMGPNGAKMEGFQAFDQSLSEHWRSLIILREREPADLSEADWESLRAAFLSLKTMRSAPILVSNSKVLAHLLPNLIAPIDRHYTLRELTPAAVPTSHERQWVRLEQRMKGYFFKVVADDRFGPKVRQWRRDGLLTPWDTSPLKIVDNLVIGLRKAEI